MRTARTLGAAQGLYLLVTGVWPLVHYRSFEWLTGPKKDEWLVQTVGGLLGTIGWTMLQSGESSDAERNVRTLGIGTAATLGTIDTIYALAGRLRPIYLADAVVEFAFVAAWLRQGQSESAGATRASRKSGATPASRR
ncbi:MAG: hypothetical protein WBL05_01220 [Brooklawnia sp.]|uniref:hypothetical protein n=1 Tax=Brooklawnia sp. TaxID=2699740 RepID=UPI003C71D3FC